MRTLTSTLLAAQKQESPVPCIKLEAVNKVAGVENYHWSSIYEGSEDDYFHALTIPADGSIVRSRIGPVSESGKVYRQRVVNPGPESDFSQWIYTNYYGAVVTAAASLGSEVSLFWIRSNREIRRLKSTDYGVNWGTAEVLDYSHTTAIHGIAAAYKPGGDVAVFIADVSVLWVLKSVDGVWQARVAWDKTTGDLSGVACAYDGDWNLLVTGKDVDGNFKMWSLVYGDGGEVAAGTWSALKEIASAPSGGDYEYVHPSLDKTDVHRGFYIEKFTGIESYSRPFALYTVPGSHYYDGLWSEATPLDITSDYGLATAHHGDYAWLAKVDAIWRATLGSQSLDLTADVVSLRQEINEKEGALIVELNNNDGKYTAPGQGDITILDKGCQLEFSPGYRTSVGKEYSAVQSYCLESIEHVSAGGKAGVILRARDGWGTLDDWSARHQMRWNKTADEKCVKDIIAVILSRAGMKLEAKSQSSTISNFYPDFTVSPSDNGKNVISKLLSLAPDLVFIEGSNAYLVNPQSTDSAAYGYGVEHIIKEGRYLQGALGINRVQVEGYDAAQGKMLIVDSFRWDEIARLYDRIKHIEDKNLNNTDEGYQRGEAFLRKAEIAAVEGTIIVPVNCGQQLYDIVEVTDVAASLTAVKRRVLGITLIYRPSRGEYLQRLELGGV